ncbi:hypothetical protein RFI_17851 [Reticulomyxa filosa]|uniref:Uncharacterized protein n=1 Tax=Reticulomyxa filosa TaxID=46433 RepID=X6N026_RETFI|nr:hypothetical protein RFI_17851 [Reticulomyxa filosa]|eukprot:ETO19381.1 hypothetical protein RFI_17851 [Reticulomyxa filosa]
MSDNEETEQASGDTKSLDDISREFKEKIGHYPHDVKQVLAYCKQQNYPYKFAEINKWWPGRENKEDKKIGKRVNADEYKEDGYSKAAPSGGDNAAKEEKSNTEETASADKTEEASKPAEENSAPAEADASANANESNENEAENEEEEEEEEN